MDLQRAKENFLNDPKSQQVSLWLTIRFDERQHRYEFLMRDSKAASFTLRSEQLLLEADRLRLQRSLVNMSEALHAPPWQSGKPATRAQRLAETGDDIAQLLLPLPLARWLAEPSLIGRELVIESDDAEVPWELARLDGMALWQRFVMTRREMVMARRDAAPPRPPQGGGWPRRALVLADPEDNLAAAREEAEAVVAALGSEWHVDLLLGRQATCVNLIDRLEHERYGLLHFACAAESGPPRLFMADEPLPASRLGHVRLPQPPALVFLNACQTAGGGHLATVSTAWSRVFLALGACCVVGTLWRVEDTVAASLVDDFYRSLRAQQPLGMALWQARRETLARTGQEAPDLHAYVMHGDAAVRLSTTGNETATEPWAIECAFHVTIGAQVIPLPPRTMLEGRRILIGCFEPEGRVNDIVIEHPQACNREAMLEFSDGQYHLVLEDREPEDGVKRRALSGGEQIRLGAVLMTFHQGPPGKPTTACRVQLIDASTQAVKREVALDTELRVGRSADCGMALDDAQVSRHHITVYRRDGVFYVRSTGSNPTLVNGMPVTGERSLQHADEIQLSANSMLRFVDPALEIFSS